MATKTPSASLFDRIGSPSKNIEWTYKGDKDEKGKRSGIGSLQYKVDYGGKLAPTFVVVEGQWENNVLHGVGSLNVNGTEVYEGNWVNGSMSLRKPSPSSTGKDLDKGGSDQGDEDSKLLGSDLDLSNPATLDGIWMLCSNTFIEDDAEVEDQNDKANAKKSNWLSTFADETLNLKEHRDLLDFISMSSSWFLGCLIIFLIFIA